MRLLITGGCGFLGSNLGEDAIIHNDDLVIFDSLQRNGSRDNLLWLQSKGSFRFEHGDIRNQNNITKVIQAFVPDAIIHLAGQVAMTTSISNPRMDFEVNTIGTMNLLEAVRQYAPDAVVIFSSTNKVYGDLEQYTYDKTDTRYVCKEYPRGFDENTRLDFKSPYGCSKGAADQYMLDYARIFGLRTVVFRHSSIYGGRQYATYDQGWVGWFCQKALEIKSGILKEPIIISGDGKQVRDVLHIEDMKTLYRMVLVRPPQNYGEAFNIGGGYENSLSLLELFTELEELLDIKIAYQKYPVRISDQKFFVADNTKISSQFLWSRNVNKKDGLRSTIAWIREQRLS